MMKHLRRTVTLLALVAVPMVVHAQTTTGVPDRAARRELAAERRALAQERREALRARRAARTPEQREAARLRRQERLNALPADQRQYLTDLRAYQQSLKQKARELRAQVQSGTITRDDMARSLQAFREANRPKRPLTMPDPAPRATP